MQFTKKNTSQRLFALVIVAVVCVIGVRLIVGSHAYTLDFPASLQGIAPPSQALQDCSSSYLSATCYQDYLNAINTARTQLEPGLPAMNINLGYLMGLPMDEQVFDITNVERISRGLPPLIALTDQLNSNALEGASSTNDPPIKKLSGLKGGANIYVKASNWAGGTYLNPLSADYAWMYNDQGGGSGWGHRDNILGRYTNGCESGYSGAAYAYLPSNKFPHSYAQVLIGACGKTPTDEGYTWQNAINRGILSAPTPPPPPPTTSSTLSSGQKLSPGEMLVSANGQYKLTFFKSNAGTILDIINNANKQVAWSTNTGPGYLILQGDGNLVQYLTINNNQLVAWASGTSNLGGTLITMQNDGNLVMTNASGAIVWSSKTGTIIDPPATLYANQKLYVNDKLYSPSDQYRLSLQGDGNLVEYNASNLPVWSTRTNGHPAADLAMQTDGNLVLYGTSGQALWYSNTRTLGGNRVTLQNDGNLVMFNAANIPVWSIETGVISQPPPPPPPPSPTLNAGQAIYLNQYLISPSGNYQLILQPDGNLVDYATATHTATWNDGTYGKPSYRLTMQTDGNLVLYGTSGQALWYSNTRTLGGNRVTLQNDGNLVMFNSSYIPVWSISTGNIPPPLPVPPSQSPGPIPVSTNTGPGVARNADGRLETFIINQGHGVWHSWQVSPGGVWSGFSDLGGNFISGLSAATNSDGRIEVFARGADNALWHIWQTTPGGGWSNWSSLGGNYYCGTSCGHQCRRTSRSIRSRW